jgi:glycosyltransferase involved in cell wall biosynthesis
MTTRPLISIITPTYNHERFIGDCIESILAQGYERWEQIIIDDGSTDHTANIIQRYNDPRIKYLHQPNRGIEALAYTYNRALEESSGELIAILEGDDTCPPDRLEKTVAAFADEKVVLVYGEVQETTVDGTLAKLNSHTRTRRSLPSQVLSNEPVGTAIPYMMTVQGHSLVAPASVTIRRTALESIGGFQYVRGLCLTDFPTFVLVATKGEFAYCPDVLGYRRMHSGSGTFEYFTEISRTQQQHVFDLLKDSRLNLSDTERAAIISDWNNEYPRAEFTQGRICLLRKRWRDARGHFEQALAPTKPRVFAAAVAGWFLSWMHCDLEGLVSLTGRVALKEGL